MQTSGRRGPCGKTGARASAWQVGTEGGERSRCTWVPVGRGRRSDDHSLVRSPDEADASTGKGMEQRDAERIQERQGGVEAKGSLSDDREKIPGLVPATFNKIFVTLLLFLDNRELSEERDSRCLALPLHKQRAGDCANRRADGEARDFCGLTEVAVIILLRFEPQEHEDRGEGQWKNTWKKMRMEAKKGPRAKL